MTVEERIQNCLDKIKDNEIEEAYNELNKIYKETKDLRAFYYITLIESDYKNKDIFDTLSNLEYIINKGNDVIRQNVYNTYLLMCFEYEIFDKMYLMSSKAIKDEYESFFVYFCYAQGLFYFKKDRSSKIEEYVNKALEIEENDDAKLSVYPFLTTYYLETNNEAKYTEVLNRVTFIDSVGVTAHIVNLLIQLYTKESIDKEIEDLVFNEPLVNTALDRITNYYFDKKEYLKAYNYASKWLQIGNKSLYLYKIMYLCLIQLERNDEAIELMKTLDLETNGYANYLLGNAYLYCYGYKKDIKEALSYYQKAYELDKDIDALIEIARCQMYLDDLESACKTIINCVRENKKVNERILRLSLNYAIKVGNFKYAKKLVKRLMGFNKKEYKIEYITTNFNYKKVLPYIKESIDSSLDKSFMFHTYFYGNYGYDVDENKVKEIVESLIEEKKEENCIDSIIGLYYLDKDPTLAVEYFSKGACRYLEHKDSCTCSIGFLAFCFLRGIGMEVDKEKAYDICLTAINQEGFTISNSVALCFAEASIELNKDLKLAYNALIKTRDNINDIAYLFMLIKIGKMLNLNVKKYEKEYKKALKFTSKKEKEYYLNNPDKILIVDTYA